MAEYFRDEEGQDVLLFIDNIFRFTQVLVEFEHVLYAYVKWQGQTCSMAGLLHSGPTT